MNKWHKRNRIDSYWKWRGWSTSKPTETETMGENQYGKGLSKLCIIFVESCMYTILPNVDIGKHEQKIIQKKHCLAVFLYNLNVRIIYLYIYAELLNRCFSWLQFGEPILSANEKKKVIAWSINLDDLLSKTNKTKSNSTEKQSSANNEVEILPWKCISFVIYKHF